MINFFSMFLYMRVYMYVYVCTCICAYVCMLMWRPEDIMDVISEVLSIFALLFILLR